MSNYLLPILILFTFIYAKTKKVNVYNSFTNGAKQSIGLVVSIFPYLVTIMIMVQFIKISGLAYLVADFISPVFKLIGIPSELCELVLLKPFSGNDLVSLRSRREIKRNLLECFGSCFAGIQQLQQALFPRFKRLQGRDV